VLREKEIIGKWRDELLLPAPSDVLVMVHAEKRDAIMLDAPFAEVCDGFRLPDSMRLRRVLKIARDYQRNAGIDSLGVSNGVLLINVDGQAYQAPLFLVSVSFAFDRFHQDYVIEPFGEQILNPFLVNLLAVPAHIDEIETLIHWLEEQNIPFELKEGVFLANFHPHRFGIIKELESILSDDELPPQVAQILGDGTQYESENLTLHDGILFPVNQRQHDVFSLVKSENLVVQGPPGTGKSQVIANLLGKVMGAGGRALLVSEKMVALEVILAKMKEVDLDAFCLLLHQQLTAKDFIQSLKKSWLFLEETPQTALAFHPVSPFMLQGLELTLDRLNQADLIGGLDFSTFLQRFDPGTPIQRIVSDLPSIPDWDREKQFLIALQEKGADLNGGWVKVRFENYQQNDKELVLDLNETMALLVLYLMQGDTYTQFRERLRLSAVAHLFFYDDVPINDQLLRSKKKQKELMQLRKKLMAVDAKLELVKNEELLWKDDVAISQMLDWIDVLKESDRWSMRYWKTKRAVGKLSTWKVEDVQGALERRIELKELERERIEIIEKLTDMGVHADRVELDQLMLMVQRIQGMDESLVKELLEMSVSERFQLKEAASNLSRLHHLCLRLFAIEPEDVMHDLVAQVEGELPAILADYALYSSLSKSCKSLLQITHNMEEAESLVLGGHWLSFSARFPELAGLNSAELSRRIEDIVATQKAEQGSYASFLTAIQVNQFQAYHQLLQTPAAKLKEADKLLKKRLKTGKSILVKEFGKSRSHKSVLSLFQSDAMLWIQVLKPILLSSPFSLAKALPMDQHLFDLVVFDEASQLPIYHALGAIYRSKRVVVAGDRQQMPPTFYFQKKAASEPLDLLHQASYHWKGVGLTHHYRSLHPDLIAFSNRYFYNNELLAFRSPKHRTAIYLEDVPEAVFENRVNRSEAKRVAEFVVSLVEAGEVEIGLVAFSQVQLDAIIQLLPMVLQEELAAETACFSFVRTLENVQGEECKHLVISLGYAKNANGHFLHQFGPLNREGGHRRLNVLMSRASERISFFRSVTSNDFKLSDNEGVDMLRKLMLELERLAAHARNSLPQSEAYIISAPHQTFTALDLVSHHRILVHRGWKVTYSLSPN
jgi:hypothetical protein